MYVYKAMSMCVVVHMVHVSNLEQCHSLLQAAGVVKLLTEGELQSGVWQMNQEAEHDRNG